MSSGTGSGARLAAVALLASLALLPVIALAQGAVTFDGERYDKAFENRKGRVPVIEYVRPPERIENWTRLVAIRHFPQLSDPKAAATDLARTVRQHNPQARFDLIAKDDGTEAMVDFITWAPGDERMEFNVHRYRKVPGTPGLVAYQFAWRFRSTELADPTAQVREHRKRFRDAMVKADLGNPFVR